MVLQIQAASLLVLQKARVVNRLVLQMEAPIVSRVSLLVLKEEMPLELLLIRAVV